MNDSDIIGSLIGMLAGLWLIAVVFVVLRIVGRWKMFEKAGIAGWHSIIPFLNQYDWFSMAGFESPWPIIGTAGTAVATVMTGVAASGGSAGVSAMAGMLLIVAIVITGIMQIMSFFMIAERFGKGAGVGILFWFFCDIMCMVAGFSDWKYTPKRARFAGSVTQKKAEMPYSEPKEDTENSESEKNEKES